MKRYENIIIESFKRNPEQSISELSFHTSIAKRTLNRYINSLISKGFIQAEGEGRGRYYKLLKNIEYFDKVAVIKSGRLVGYLSFDEGRYGFEYDKEYKYKVLDGLEKDKKSTSFSLFAIFENLIPESARRDLYLKENKNLLKILLNLDNTHGDFEFVEVDKIAKYKKSYKNRPNWVEIKDKILDEFKFFNILDFKIDIEDEILEDIGKHSSLSGYQNKIDIDIDFENRLVMQSKDPKYLLKPYNPLTSIYDFKDKEQIYLPYMGLNEHLFMSFAKNAYGFDVPWSAVIAGKSDFHYLVKRYDRYDSYRYEQRDFAQIIGIKSDQKYFSTSEKLFDAIAKVVKSKDARLKFLEFYIFSFMIEHADLHLKNISIINIGKDRYRLSPLYDLISNGIYRGDRDELGLPLAGKRHNILVDDFFDIASRVGISKLQTKKSIKRIVDIFVEEFPKYIDLSKDIKLYDKLKINEGRYSFSSFSKHLERFYFRRVESLRKRGFI